MEDYYFRSRRGLSQDQVEFYLENVNSIVNLQLLEDIPNIEKSDQDFAEWVNETYKDSAAKSDYFTKHYGPSLDLSVTNFEEFIKVRKELLFQKLRSIV